MPLKRPCLDCAAPTPTTRCPACAAHHNAQQPRPRDTRPTAAQRGYDGKWRRLRTAYLTRNRRCLDCGAPATVADHRPTPRRELVARGDPDPDADHHLEPRCVPCHNRITARTRR